ncbi:MAG: protein kinase domain-containing protein [Anaerolineae bacterium]
MESQPLPPGTILKNRYRITRLIAGGGMAWVYEVAEDLPDGRTRVWAMKELRADEADTQALQEGRALFEQEANILVTLDHPNLPKVAAFFQEGGKVYLVMEYVRGESLQKRQEQTGAPLLESVVVEWAVQICEVLQYLHTRQPPVIFRDMKPSNVMVTPSGRVMLIDFGIARTYKLGKRKDTVTMGSENYAAPEQWGKAQSDGRADIYALGATMYHLLTNVAPLPHFVPTPRVPIRQYNPAVSEKLAAVIEHAMAQDREQRYATAREMQLALLDTVSRAERRRLELLLQQTSREPAVMAVGAGINGRPAASPALPPARHASFSGAMPAGAAAPDPSAAAAVDPNSYVKPCPRCAALNRPGARFCRRCAYAFAPPLPAILRVLMPPQAHWEFPLRDGETLLGRQGGVLKVQLDLDFYDPDGFVSRNHARVVTAQRRYELTDLGSANGTFVNGKRLVPNQPYLLTNNDRIRVGRIVLQFLVR